VLYHKNQSDYAKKMNALIKVISLCISLLSFNLFANEVELLEENIDPPVIRFNYNIKPGIDVFFSPKLLQFFEHNFDTVLEQNGFSPSSYYSSQFTYNSGEKTLDDMISNSKTLSSVKSIRYYFRKFFQGIRIRDNHNFNLNVEGIDLSANWKSFGITIDQDPEAENKIIATLHLETDRLSLNLRSFKIDDEKHDFIGKVGGDKIFLNLDQLDAPNLKIKIPVEIETYNGSFEQIINPEPFNDGDLKFRVKEIETNIDQIKLNAGWNAPLTMPSVSVSINGRTARLRADRVEQSIKRQIPKLVEGMQESLQKYVVENTPEVIEGYLNNRFQSGYLDMVRFEPFFAPEDELVRILESGEFEDIYYPNAYVLGLKFKNLSLQENHLKVSIATFMEDGLSEDNNQFKTIYKKRELYPSELYTESGLDHDIAAIVNIDIINQFIKLSCDRGYFEKVDLGTGSPLKVSNCPYVYVNKNEKELRFVAEIEDKIDGFFKSKVVRNPIRVKFEVGLKLELAENGLYNLKLTRLYENSLLIKDKYIRMKIFKKSVIKAGKKMLKNLNKEFADYSVYEGVPLPNTIGGISLKNLGVRYHKNGYIVLYMKTVL
jgi:hypothetical protein